MMGAEEFAQLASLLRIGADTALHIASERQLELERICRAVSTAKALAAELDDISDIYRAADRRSMGRKGDA